MITTIRVDIRDHEVVILDFSETAFMDDSAALVVEQMIDSAIEEDTECIVMGLGGQRTDIHRALDVLRRVPDGRIAVTMDDAREMARRILDGRTR